MPCAQLCPGGLQSRCSKKGRQTTIQCGVRCQQTKVTHVKKAFEDRAHATGGTV